MIVMASKVYRKASMSMVALGQMTSYPISLVGDCLVAWEVEVLVEGSASEEKIPSILLS